MRDMAADLELDSSLRTNLPAAQFRLAVLHGEPTRYLQVCELNYRPVTGLKHFQIDNDPISGLMWQRLARTKLRGNS
jgi:hypothetical protein